MRKDSIVISRWFITGNYELFCRSFTSYVSVGKIYLEETRVSFTLERYKAREWQIKRLNDTDMHVNND